MEDPSDDDIELLPHINFCSPGIWNPDGQHDDDNDEKWFDASDGEELDYLEFLDSNDGWSIPDDELSATMKHNLNAAKINVNGLSHHNKPWDFDALCPFFAYKPVEVVKHTMAAMTQFAKSVL